jgi:hypothetical protein
MTYSDELYDLLPALYRRRDAEQGYPLQTLLRVMDTQASALRSDIWQLYDNWFIETCQDWVVPQLAALVNEPVGAVGDSAVDRAGGALTLRARRRQVANAVAQRGAVGTMTSLEQLATETTGWPCRAIEFGKAVAINASVRHPELARGRLIDTNDGDALERLGSVFGAEAHLVDVRALSSHRQPGRYNLPTVGLAVWRLVPDGPRRAPAACVDGEVNYTFDTLGRDIALCVQPWPRTPGSPPPTDVDVPTLISRSALERMPEIFYGPGRSMCIYRGTEPVPRSEIVVADLSRWHHHAEVGQVLLDPAAGRFAFPRRHRPKDGVWVEYRHLSVGPLGGGSYARPLPMPATAVYRVSAAEGTSPGTIAQALTKWRADRAAGSAGPQAAIEIADDEVYEEPLRISIAPGEHLEIRAAQGCRPLLRPMQPHANRPDVLRVSGIAAEDDAGPQEAPPARPAGRRSRRPKGGAHPEPAAAPVAPSQPRPLPAVTFNGVLIAGAPIELEGQLGAVTLQHCTLEPGRESGPAGSRGIEPSILIGSSTCRLTIESCVLGRIRSANPEDGRDPVPVHISDSILDSSHPSGEAVAGGDGRRGFLELSLHRVTVLGRAHVYQVGVVQDSIVTGSLRSKRTQVGTVSFSYLPAGSVTPTRTNCQPDLVVAAALTAAAASAEASRVAPGFDSVRFGAASYARLGDDTAVELLRGAHDEGEMGAHHNFWLRLRVAELQARLPDFTPVGNDINVLYAT